MLPKYEHFKFEVGQFVCMAYAALNPKIRENDVYQIVERMYQECPGGVQLHYMVRSQGFNRDNYLRFNEIELAAIAKATDE